MIELLSMLNAFFFLLWLYTFDQGMKRNNTTIKELVEARREASKWKMIAKLHGYKDE